jgi:hypothetical protein
MKLNLLDEIGNWNPQLFRELKGRLKSGNVAVVSALSICGQLMSQLKLAGKSASKALLRT